MERPSIIQVDISVKLAAIFHAHLAAIETDEHSAVRGGGSEPQAQGKGLRIGDEQRSADEAAGSIQVEGLSHRAGCEGDSALQSPVVSVPDVERVALARPPISQTRGRCCALEVGCKG